MVAKVENRYVPIPVNIDTVNLLLNENISTRVEMRKWLSKNQLKYQSLKNGEEAALSRVGKHLYEKLFKNYTFKQWSKYPNELNASVLLRIPVSDNYDDRYFPNDLYQALPKYGYTKLVKNMLTHRNITVILNTDFFDFKMREDFKVERTIYTGPIDHYFKDSGLPMLEYRSIIFEAKTIHNRSFYQPNSVVNYPNGPAKFTRIVEYKHFLAQKSPHTTIVKEFTTDKGDPYYPVPNRRNQVLYNKYKLLALQEEENANVHFVGRLANYKYFNMDAAILNAINTFTEINQLTPNVPPSIVQTKTETYSLTIITNECNGILDLLNYLMDFKKKLIKIVIYNTCKGLNSINQQILNNHLFFVIDSPNVGWPVYSWLNFILSKQSLFSDINIFLNEHFTFEKLQTKLKYISLTKLQLSAHNIQNSSLIPEEHFFAIPLKKTESLPQNKNDYFNELDNELCHWIESMFIFCTFCNNHERYSEIYVATETLVRRILVKYRWQLNEVYNTLPVKNYTFNVNTLNHMWKKLFTSDNCA